jgi:hypothetical protein
MAYRRNVIEGIGMETGGAGGKRKGREGRMKLISKKAVKGDESVNNMRDTRKQTEEHN